MVRFWVLSINHCIETLRLAFSYEGSYLATAREIDWRSSWQLSKLQASRAVTTILRKIQGVEYVVQPTLNPVFHIFQKAKYIPKIWNLHRLYATSFHQRKKKGQSRQNWTSYQWLMFGTYHSSGIMAIRKSAGGDDMRYSFHIILRKRGPVESITVK